MKHRPFLITFLISCLLWVTPIQAEFSAPYQEIADPSIDMSVQGLRMLQLQWFNWAQYTINLQTPGYIEIGLYGHRDGNKLHNLPFYRFRQGPVGETNRELDFYIDSGGKGFFVVDIGSGYAFTMDGRFKLDQNRRLIMINGGFPVMGESGEIFLPEGNEIHASSTGTIYVDGNPVEKFKVVVFQNFDDMQNLETINGSVFYLQKEIATLEGPEYYKVRQGFIVQNNVLKALVGDMKFLKAYEYSAKSAKAIATLLGEAGSLAAP